MTRTRKKKVMITVITIMLLLIGTISSYAFYQYNQLFKRIYRPLGEQSNPPLIGVGAASNPVQTSNKAQELEKKKTMKAFTMLLVGIDSRGEEHARSDSMFFAIVNPGKQALALIPITRDIYVEVPGHGMEKMNHAMFYGGVPLLKQTLEGYFGIPIERYVTVDFEGFRRLIDEIGGVEIEVKKRMKYYDPTDGTNINLYKGMQTLDGKKALDYARYRRSNIARDDTDEERSGRQIELMRAIIEQGKEKFSLLQVFTFFDIASEHIKTDLSKEEIEMLVPIYKGFSAEKIQTTSIAGEGKRLPYGNLRLYFYVVDEEEKERIKAYIKEALQP